MNHEDTWGALRAHTVARIALGRAGISLPTHEWLRFAQAQARDTLHQASDAAALLQALHEAGYAALQVDSAAPDRTVYLRRPDLGRRLAAPSAAALQQLPVKADLVVVLADGLPARATQTHALPRLPALAPRPRAQGQQLGPVVVALQARVALGDSIGALLQARAVLVLIGERPGLSAPDSLGAYLTWLPQVGCSNAQRNCASDIRPAGLAVDMAAFKIAWLLDAARALGATGVVLKDRSDTATPAASAPPLLP